MKKQTIIFLVFILVLSLSNSREVFASTKKNLNVITQKYNYFLDFEDSDDVVNYFDEIFIGVIRNNNNNTKYDGTLLNIPISNYKVDVLKVFKGDLGEGKIDLAFYGGYSDKNTIEIIEKAVSYESYLPEREQVYLFRVNKNMNEENNRISKSSYVVFNPYQMVELHEYDFESEFHMQSIEIVNTVVQNSTSNKAIIGIGPCVEFICSDDGSGGTGGGTPPTNDGSSITGAIDITIGNNIQIDLSSTPKYYIVNPTLSADIEFNLDILSGLGVPRMEIFYGSIDATTENQLNNVLVYSQYEKYYDINYRLSHTEGNSQSDLVGYGMIKLQGDALYVKMYTESINSVTVGLNTSVQSSSCRTSSPTDLKLSTYSYLDADETYNRFESAVVDFYGENKIVYEHTKITSTVYFDYFEVAVGRWNDLGKVDIVNSNSTSFDKTLMIYNIDDINMPVTPTFYPYYDHLQEPGSVGNYFHALMFSEFYMDYVYGTPTIDSNGNMNSAGKLWSYAFTHELGHALGLAEFNKFTIPDFLDGTSIQENRFNFMVQTPNDYVVNLGSCEIYVYNTLY